MFHQATAYFKGHAQWDKIRSIVNLYKILNFKGIGSFFPCTQTPFQHFSGHFSNNNNNSDFIYQIQILFFFYRS